MSEPPDFRRLDLPKPQREVVVTDGEPFVCDGCGKPIDGEAWFQNGQPFCPGCWVMRFGEG